MMMFYKAKIVIVNNTRVGSTAIFRKLARFSDIALPPWGGKHLPCSRCQAGLVQFYGHEADAFHYLGLVRHPVSWLHSWARQVGIVPKEQKRPDGSPESLLMLENLLELRFSSSVLGGRNVLQHQILDGSAEVYSYENMAPFCRRVNKKLARVNPEIEKISSGGRQFSDAQLQNYNDIWDKLGTESRELLEKDYVLWQATYSTSSVDTSDSN